MDKIRANILLVDDEPYIIELLTTLLELRSIYTIYKAANGKEAIDILQNEHIDIVITDIVMPEIDGMKLLHFLNHHFPNILAIVITGNSLTIDTAVNSMKAGAVDFIDKSKLKHVDVLDEIIQTHFKNKYNIKLLIRKTLRKTVSIYEELTGNNKLELIREVNKFKASEIWIINNYFNRAKKIETILSDSEAFIKNKIYKKDNGTSTLITAEYVLKTYDVPSDHRDELLQLCSALKQLRKNLE